MNIEESIDNVKFIIGDLKASNYNQTFIQAIETLLTAYEKEKEKNKKLEDTLKCTQNSWYEDTKVIEKQSKEIEYQIEKRANQKKELAILNAKQVEFNKLVNTVNSYKGQFKKQQKEIEELKDKCKELYNPSDMILRYYDTKKGTQVEIKGFVPTDKIKAKIEEYENKIKKIRSKKLINEPEDTINITRYTHYISVLQSLLEKE